MRNIQFSLAKESASYTNLEEYSSSEQARINEENIKKEPKEPPYTKERIFLIDGKKTYKWCSKCKTGSPLFASACDKAVGVTQEVKKEILRRFQESGGRRTSWDFITPDNFDQAIIMNVPDEGSAALAKEYVQKNDGEYQYHWRQKIIKEFGVKPIETFSNAYILQVVSKVVWRNRCDLYVELVRSCIERENPYGEFIVGGCSVPVELHDYSQYIVDEIIESEESPHDTYVSKI